MPDTWGPRLAHHGPTGFSAEGYARLQAAAARPRPYQRRTQCAHGHPYTPANTYVSPTDGKRRCRICLARRRSRARRAATPAGLILAGDSPRTVAARAAFARRRERYGTSGCSDTGLAHLREAAARARPRQPRTWCARGHRYTRANTYVNPDGRRRCRACALLARHRARWARNLADKLLALKRAMLRAHPDAGGTGRRFIAARRRYLAALAAHLTQPH